MHTFRALPVEWFAKRSFKYCSGEGEVPYYSIGRVATLAAVFVTASAFVQTVAAQTVEPAATLDEVVVTAQRREENLQHAAVAVDVASGEELAKSGLSSVLQLQQVSPSLNVSSSGGANSTFFIRGVGNFSTNAYSDPATAFSFDGVYIGRPSGTAGLFYDLERIEVLKGPQGTLYGRNATAGAINVLPARPKLGEFSGNLVASYGNYSAANVQGAINVPVGERAAVRFSGNVVDHEGYLSDGTSDEKVKAARLQLLDEVTSNLSVRIDADYTRVSGKGVGATYVARVGAYDATTRRYSFTSTGLDNSIGVLDPRSQAYRQTVPGIAGSFLPQLPADQHLRDTFYGVSSEITYTAPIGTLTIVPAYRKASQNDQHSSPGFTPFTQEDFNQRSLEVRLGGSGARVDYIVGAYYYKENIHGNYTFAQQNLSSYQDFDTGTDSTALFGRLTAKLTDAFRLTGGLRYTRDKKRMDGRVDTLVQICFAPSCPLQPYLPVTDTVDQIPWTVAGPGGGLTPDVVNGIPIGAFTGTGPSGAFTLRAPTLVNTAQSANKSTFRIAAEYDLAPESLLYLSFENGFHSGGFSLAFGRETFQPEFIDAYTLGVKNRFQDNRLQFNVEGFFWKYRDQQVAHFGLDGRGNNAFFTENVGRSTVKGIETDLQFAATANTLLNASVQYLTATFDSFAFKVPASAGNPNNGCDFGPDPSSATLTIVDCSGKTAYQSPKWTINLGAQQKLALSNGKQLALAADTQYRSERYVAFEFVSPLIAPADWMSNISASYGPQDENWSLSAFVRNVGDKRSLTSGTVYSGKLVAARQTSPRTYGIRFLKSF
jgi:iron complex outermembrane receptor protein